MVDVCCLGILVADVTVASVDTLPQKGKLNFADKIMLSVGGCAANTAIDLEKIGIKTSVIGKVGLDDFGNYILDNLSKEGVDIKGIEVSNDATSAAIVVVNSKGERSFIHCPGSNGTFNINDVNLSIVKDAKILFIAGALLMPKLDGIPTAEILKEAKEAGVYTALDTTWDAKGRWMEDIEPCLRYLDLFIPSIEEAKEISGKDDIEQMADVFLQRGVSLCVIKNGKKGCYIKSKSGDELSIPCYDRIKAKDTNGAGDSFVAGFLTGILNGWDLEQCGRFANAVGAYCVSAHGASSGIQSKNNILYFMDEYKKGNDII